MEIFLTIVIFVTVLVVLVVIHELGHFFAAKKSGVRVDEFGFGFPPRLFGKKFGETTYTVNLLPLGGFVKIKGIAGEDESEMKDPDSFAALGFPKKIAILFAGIGMNFILAILLFALAYSIGVQADPATTDTGAIVSNEQIVAAAVEEGKPAQRVGLQAGDVITAVNGTSLTTVDEFRGLIESQQGTEVTLEIDRNGEQLSLPVTPEKFESEGETIVGIGVGLSEVATVRYPWYQSFWIGIKKTATLTMAIFGFLGTMIANLFTSAPVDTESVSGPVGLAVVIKSAADSGIAQLILISAFLSVNLAVFNLLPIPMLDGGRIMFTIIERVRKKPLPASAEALIHNIGFLLLLGMIIIVTFRDIIRL